MKNNEKINKLVTSKYFSNTIWLLAEKILRMGVTFFTTLWMARFLGPEQYGIYSYSLSVIGLMSILSTLGLDSIVVRDLVKNKLNMDKIIVSTFTLKLLGGFIAVALATTGYIASVHADTTGLVICAMSLSLVFGSFNVIDYYFQSQVKSKYVVLANTISLFTSSIIKVLLIVNEMPLIYFALAYSVDALVLCLTLVYFYWKKEEKFVRTGKHIDMMKSLLSNSWPLMLSGASFILFSNIDNLMINNYLGAESVGIYSAAYKLSTLWYFMPGMLLSSFMPAIVKAASHQQLLNASLQKLSSALIYFSLTLAIFVYFFNEKIIILTFGQEYLEAAAVLKVLIWVNVLIFFNSVWNKWMVVINKTKRSLVFHLMTALFNIILNVILISEYGAIGAAYALLLSLLLTYAIHFYMYRDFLFLLLNSLTFGKLNNG